MHDAVQLLGISMEDFTQLMVLTLSRTAAKAGDPSKGQEKEQQSKQNMQQAALPFEVVALAYRRCVWRALFKVHRAVKWLRCKGSVRQCNPSIFSLNWQSLSMQVLVDDSVMRSIWSALCK